jgi:uncharacterized membrane protein YbhN (UPF0104 family)
MSKSKSDNKKYNWRAIAGVVVSIAAVIFVYLQWDTIKKSLEALQRADWLFVIMAIAVYTMTIIAAAAVIYNLRLVQKLKYTQLLLVQTATLFLGRITPASVGGLAAMARVLFTQGHTVVQSGTVVAAAGIATFLGNIILAAIALLLSFQSAQLSDIKIPGFIIYVAVAAAIVVGILLCIKNIRSRVKKIIDDVFETLRYYQHRKKSILLAILFGAIVTFCFAVTLMLVAKSLDVNISLFAAIVTVSLGSLGVAVTPLPGGVVGAEAALAATLTQFGVAAEVALAIAFVYRFVIFWLPLVPGYIASQYSLKKELL